MGEITPADKLKEIERELGQRRWVYPRLVSSGKLTQQKAHAYPVNAHNG